MNMNPIASAIAFAVIVAAVVVLHALGKGDKVTDTVLGVSAAATALLPVVNKLRQHTVVIDGRTFRSTDGGETWTEVRS